MITQIVINIVLSVAIYLIISVSFSLIYYVIRFFHLAHGATICLGAYFTYFFFHQLQVSIWISSILAIFISIFVSLLIEIGVYNPLRRKKVSQLMLLIVSLSIYVILQNVISMLWGDEIKSISPREIKIGNEILGAYITDIQIVIIVSCTILFLTYIIFLKHTIIGRNIRAIASNSELASINGINSNRIILWSVGIGSGLAALIGILVSSDTGLTPTMGFNLLLYGIVTMIIGGVGSTWGLIGGAFLLATTQHLTSFYLDSKWMDAVTYLILILFLIWKPLGFSGKRLKKIEI